MNLSDITALYVGATAVVAVHKGTTLVWEAAEEPPAGGGSMWVAFDFDPFNPLLNADMLVTKVLT